MGAMGHQVDVYFRSEEYIRDFGLGHHLLSLGQVMLNHCSRHRKVRAHYNVVKNARAFGEAAGMKRKAALQQQADAADIARLAADELGANEVASGIESSLRETNRVDTSLDSFEMGEEVDMDEFEEEFGGVSLEGHCAEMELGENYGVKELNKEFEGMEL